MTAQSSGKFNYKEKEYSIAFPSELGIYPVSISREETGGSMLMPTSCENGYLPRYKVSNSLLVLDSLLVASYQQKPEHEVERIRREPTFESVCEPIVSRVINGIAPEPYFSGGFNNLYLGLDVPILHTGDIFLGRGIDTFMTDDIVISPHLWRYNEVIQLIFSGGELIKEKDVSGIAEVIRRRHTEDGYVEELNFAEETVPLENFILESYYSES